jgi:SlyX protein
MQDPHTIDQRLTDLEIKASFTEDLVESLNQIIITQQDQIAALVRQVAQLRDQLPEAGQSPQRNLHDDLPPHF